MKNDVHLDFNNIVVCSDLHLGEAKSVFHDAPEEFQRFANAIDAIGESSGQIDALVLAGDVLDLSLATYHEAFSDFLALMQAVEGKVKEVVYVPGNHDHHIWLASNEGNGVFAQGQHVPQGFAAKTRESYLEHALDALVSSGDTPLRVEYPNSIWCPKNGSSAIVIHHGHFLEDLYHLMSDLYKELLGLDASSLEDLEAINSGWIEFIWYSFGQCGRHGANGPIEQIYQRVSAGDTAQLKSILQRFYEYRLKKMVDTKLRSTLSALPNMLSEWVSKKLHEKIPEWVYSALESYIEEEMAKGRDHACNIRNCPLDEGLVKRSGDYLLNYVRPFYPEISARNMDFIFGHTHRPGIYRSDVGIGFYNCGAFHKGSTAFLFHCNSQGEIAEHLYAC
ncbi:MAG: metallophosphoesterase [Deltaproteobacteria bacterium]|nr:metallophosphoesterase [Deltaproteobacteria bacterium]